MTDVFDADSLERLIASYTRLLEEHEGQINALNVFPVADGDTGTNMLLTVRGVMDALAEIGTTIADACAAARRGVLMSARGSSGIIFGQWLRACLADLAAADTIDAPVMARALASAADAAYGAVDEPVEGTMLTVARSAAEGAAGADDASDSWADLWAGADAAASEAVERSPEQLPVLRRAGVVDSGAYALALFFKAARGADDVEMPTVAEPRAQPTAPAAEIRTPMSERAYEVTFLLDAESATPLLERWTGLGDEVVVAGDGTDGGWRCHIHTDDLAAAIQAGIDSGRVHGLHIEELPGAPQCHADHRTADADVCTGVVSVAVGAGIAARMRDLGATVVECNRTMNASIGEIAQAIEAGAGDAVVVLPNDPDTIAACRSASELVDRPARVLETRALGTGLACLERHEPQAEIDADLAAMRDGFGVPWAEIAEVVRDAHTDVGDVVVGQWVAIEADGITLVDSDPIAAGLRALDTLGDVTCLEIFPGRQATGGDTDTFVAKIRSRVPGVDIRMRAGGQPYAAWLIRPARAEPAAAARPNGAGADSN